MRDHGDTLAFAPRLPPRLRRLGFRLLYRGRSVRVEVDSDSARYEILDGEPIELAHHGERFVLEPGSPQERELPPPPARLKVEPPPGRIPPLRHREA